MTPGYFFMKMSQCIIFMMTSDQAMLWLRLSGPRRWTLTWLASWSSTTSPSSNHHFTHLGGIMENIVIFCHQHPALRDQVPLLWVHRKRLHPHVGQEHGWQGLFSWSYKCLFTYIYAFLICSKGVVLPQQEHHFGQVHFRAGLRWWVWHGWDCPTDHKRNRPL